MVLSGAVLTVWRVWGVRLLLALLVLGLVASGLWAVSPEPARAQSDGVVEVPEDWALIPSGLGVGAEFRLLFMTSQRRDATSSDIAGYNTHVQNAAAAGHAAIREHSSLFKAVGSTSAVAARDNIGMNPNNSAHPDVPVYWLGGPRVAANTAGFWSLTWENWRQADRRFETGSVADDNFPWTGTNTDGTSDGLPLGHGTLVRVGWFDRGGDNNPLKHSGAPPGDMRSLYGISPVFRVVDDTVEVPEGWALVPSGLGAGAEFRLLFITDTPWRDASSSDIADYDAFVQAKAAAGHAAIREHSSLFRVVGSTGSVDARDHVEATGAGVPIYWLGGAKVADGYADFWDGSWDNHAVGDRRNASGQASDSQTRNDWPWTGTDDDGTKHANPLGDTNNARRGAFGSNSPLSHNTAARTQDHAFYAISPVFRVAAATTTRTPGTRPFPSFDPVVAHSGGETRVVEGGAADSFTYTLGDELSGCRVLEVFAGSGLEVRLPSGPPGFVQRYSWSVCEFYRNVAQGIEVRAVDDGWDVPGIWRQPGNTGDTYTSQVRIYETAAGRNLPVVAPVVVPVTIVDNDPPMLSLSGGDPVEEGAPAAFKVVATSPPPAALTVRYRVRQNDPFVIFPGDFVAPADLGVKTVVLPAGEMSAGFEVPTAADELDEADGSVRVTLLSGSGYTLAGPAYMEVAVIDDDPAVLTLVDPGFVFEGRTATFKVKSTSPAKDGLTVSYEASETGNFFADSVLGEHSVRFPNNSRTATISIPTVDDSLWDPRAALTVALRAGTGYVLGDPSEATIAVLDLYRDYNFETDPGKDREPDPGDGGGDPGDEPDKDSQPDTDQGEPDDGESGDPGDGDPGKSDGDQGDGDQGDGDPGDGDQGDGDPGDGEGGGGEPSQTEAGGDSQACGSADALAAKARANHDALANTAANRKERNDWWRAWIALSGKTGTYNTPLTATEARALETGDARWTPFRAALECLEGAPPPATPEVSVTAGSGVTEGSDASFTVTADPAPAQPLAVSVTVSQDGDFGATTGTRSVTVPTGGTATVTVSTTDDDADEPDGTVTVTVSSGSGYTVSTTQSSASVAVADDDDPPPAVPEVSVTAGSGITEGGDASFTVSASPAPAAPLQVSVTVAQNGDWGATAGSRAVTVGTGGSATLTVSTADDDADEPDGSVSVTVDPGDGYTVSTAQSSATVAVSDDDDPPPAVPEISVTAGSGVTEGSDAQFTVTADPAPAAPLTVSVTVAQSGDWGATTGTRSVTVPTSGTATVTVATDDDDADEPDGSVSVTVAGGSGYTVSTAHGSASVAVSDDDDPPPADLPVVSVSDASVAEGELGWLSPLEFRLALSRPSDQNITVRYRVHLGTTSPSDHYGGSGRATIWAGRTHAAIVVLVVDDTRREPEEALEIELTGADGAAIDADNNTAVGTITDND